MFRIFSIAAASLFLITGCTPLGVGLGATAGVAAVQEGGLSRATSDARIQLAINDLWFREDVDIFTKLDLTVSQGRVLITGVVQNPEHRVEAVRLAWQPVGVKQVINEIQVAESKGFVGFAKDTWITTRIRTALTFDRNVQSINYSIDTVQGTVYLMGFAQDRAELNRVIETARTVNGVNGVVSYVKFVGGTEQISSTPDQSVTYESYEDPNTPLDLRAPQADPNALGEYPNNVAPVQEDVPRQPVVIRGDPVEVSSGSAAIPSVERQDIRSEDILWDDQ